MCKTEYFLLPYENNSGTVLVLDFNADLNKACDALDLICISNEFQSLIDGRMNEFVVKEFVVCCFELFSLRHDECD